MESTGIATPTPGVVRGPVCVTLCSRYKVETNPWEELRAGQGLVFFLQPERLAWRLMFGEGMKSENVVGPVLQEEFQGPRLLWPHLQTQDLHLHGGPGPATHSFPALLQGRQHGWPRDVGPEVPVTAPLPPRPTKHLPVHTSSLADSLSQALC